MNRYAKLIDGEIVTTEDIIDWAKWFETADRRIAKTELDDCEVSTVFLGLNHFNGRDMWFETMVFGGTYDGECRRYGNLEEARQGHNVMVQYVRGI